MQINEITDIKLTEDFNNQEKRNYLGVSGLGDECARRIQYIYQHAPQKITANQIRTFDIGHKLEDLVAEWLIKSRFELKTRNEEGKQFGFSTAEGRIQGHVDGIIVDFSEDLKEIGLRPQALWESKTMNSKNWSEVNKYGVFATKFGYYVQVQLYMAYLDLEQCLFTALNKDSSELYFEIISFDSETAQKYSDRAVNILKACENNELLPRIAVDSAFFKCKMCPFYEICWKENN